VGPLINAATGLSGNALVMTGHSGWALLAVGTGFLVNLGADLLLSPRLGLVGAAWGTLAGFVVLSVIQQVGLWRRLKVRFQVRRLVIPMLAAVGAFAAAYPLVMNTEPPGVTRAILASLAFLALYLILVVITCPHERRWLASWLARFTGRRGRQVDGP
jgi:O-antigen/teichoic acid export membrane protein